MVTQILEVPVCVAPDWKRHHQIIVTRVLAGSWVCLVFSGSEGKFVI